MAAQDNTVTFCSGGKYAQKVTLEGCPKGMSAAGSTVAVVTGPKDELVLIKSTALQPVVKLSFSPCAPQRLEPCWMLIDASPAAHASGPCLCRDSTCVSVAANEGMIAVGAEGEPASVYILDGAGNEVKKLDRHKMMIAAVAFAPDCALLASGCANKEVVVWDVQAGTPLHTGMGGFHTARISSLAWSAAGVLASAGVDSLLLVWDFEAKKPKTSLKLCHKSGGINKHVWIDDATIATCGSDACIKTWSV